MLDTYTGWLLRVELGNDTSAVISVYAKTADRAVEIARLRFHAAPINPHHWCGIEYPSLDKFDIVDMEVRT